MNKEKNWTIAEMPEGTIPNCDFCESIAEYDAKVSPRGLVWAYFCEEHFASESNQKLGLGLGQRIVQVPFVRD
jgi:hypothetical protein